MEECLPYKKEVGGLIPPFPNDIIISVKNNYISKQKIRDKWPNKEIQVAKQNNQNSYIKLLKTIKLVTKKWEMWN